MEDVLQGWKPGQVFSTPATTHLDPQAIIAPSSFSSHAFVLIPSTMP